jgi:hypothetical protein
MVEEKLRKCKDKKEFMELLKKYLTTSIDDTLGRKVGMAHNALYTGILIFTSEFLSGTRNERSYKRAIRWTLNKYKEGQEELVKRLESKIEEVVKLIVGAYPVIKELPGDYNFLEELKRKTEESDKRESYIV